MIRTFLLFAVLLWLLVVHCSCRSRDIVPDAIMVGQGVGEKADGTFVYVNWAIPQPE